MEWIVRQATGRNLMILIILILCAAFINHFKEYPQRRYHEWRYPPQKGETVLGAEIMDALEKQDSLRLQRQYRRIVEILKLSRAEGFEVSDLERDAKEVLQLDRKGKRTQALERLYRIELDIPRGKKQYIPTDAPILNDTGSD